jgi:hypothetical protein
MEEIQYPHVVTGPRNLGPFRRSIIVCPVKALLYRAFCEASTISRTSGDHEPCGTMSP